MQNSAEQIADEILVMDAQGGRGDAFETLVSRWQKRLWWHAFNLTARIEFRKHWESPGRISPAPIPASGKG